MASIVDAVLEHRTDKRPAIVADGASTSYQELVELTSRLTGGLTRHVTAGQDICLLVSHPGLVESVALTLAGWSLGLRVAPVPDSLTARERDGVIAHCRPVVSVSAETSDSADSLAFGTLADGPVSRPSTAVDAWLETFTSGTIGRSKCVDRRVSRLSSDIEQLVSATGLTAADTVSSLTTALSTTAVLPALCAGATIAAITLRSPRQFWQALGERSVTVLSCTPYIYEFAVRSRPDMTQLAGLRLALTTSARLRPTTAHQIMQDAGVPIRNILCSSEAGHIAYNDADDRDVLARSVGRPFAGVEVEIRGADGRAVPVGQAGRIWVRSSRPASV